MFFSKKTFCLYQHLFYLNKKTVGNADLLTCYLASQFPISCLVLNTPADKPNSFAKFKGLKESFQLIDNTFLQWFVGFFEGDGYFSITKRQNIKFGISLSSVDKPCLEYIQATLGFGFIYKQGPRKHQFCVENLEGLRNLLHIFNGNLVLPTRKKKLLQIIELYNQKAPKRGLEQITPLGCDRLPTLEDAWLSGFTDAEGCFNVSFEQKRAHIHYSVCQSGEENLTILSYLILLFQAGNVYSHKSHKKPHYRFLVCGSKNCFKVYNYFESFPLKTTKRESFVIWQEVHAKIEAKQHLEEETRALLVERAKKINTLNKLAKIGKTT
jgi:hypothetical protein